MLAADTQIVPDLVLPSGIVIALLIALIAGIWLRSRRLFGKLGTLEAERAEHARQLQDSNARLTSSLKAAEIRTKEIALLTELSGLLQSCQKPNEIFAAVETYAGFLFPNEAGALYLMNDARDGVTRGPRWGEVASTSQAFSRWRIAGRCDVAPSSRSPRRARVWSAAMPAVRLAPASMSASR